MAHSKTSGTRLKGLARRQDAVELRLSGLSYRAIAAALGVSPARAHVLVSDALDRTLADLGEKADHLRALELERLDGLLAGLWSKATAGDVAASLACLRIAERRSRMLGLDAKGSDPGETELKIILPKGWPPNDPADSTD